MAEFTFFYNPMSRSQIARWALHETGSDYAAVMVEWEAKPQALLDANPMGKLPTIIHHAANGDHVVTEAAAICHYLAEAAASGLLPRPGEKASYFRWLLFAAGPLESATTCKAMGWEPKGARQEALLGFGSYDRMVDTLDTWLRENDYVCGSRFTMADVYVGSQIDWGLAFSTLPERASFRAYRARVQSRRAYQQARQIDMDLIGEAEKVVGAGS